MDEPTGGVTVRRAVRADADALAALWRDFVAEQGALDARLVPSPDADRLWRATLREAWDDGVPTIWLATAAADRDGDRLDGALAADRDGARSGVHASGDEILAFLVAEPFHASPVYVDVAEVHIGELYVRPGARRLGVALHLLDAVAASSREQGARRVRFGVASANAAARSLVARWGAAPLAVTYTRDV